ncbi:MAG TPA: hypothetical protein VNN72_01995 [Polyangiaceae bacterium]|nr:hypothetical protein [Polyangiaceae bacterium]
MMATKMPRCPYCGLSGLREDGRPVLPGMLIVCAGCAGPSRYSDDGERLIVLEPGDWSTSLAGDVLGLQQRVRASFVPYRGHPPGFRWASAELCDSCWAEFEPERKPVRVRGAPAEPCGFCGERTDSGIMRRILKREEPGA